MFKKILLTIAATVFVGSLAAAVPTPAEAAGLCHKQQAKATDGRGLFHRWCARDRMVKGWRGHREGKVKGWRAHRETKVKGWRHRREARVAGWHKRDKKERHGLFARLQARKAAKASKA